MTHPAFIQFKKLEDTLIEDAEEAQRRYSQDPSDFNARMLVKTLFTYVEGHLYAFKQVTLALEEVLAPPFPPADPTRRRSKYVVLFSDEERAMLEEFTYRLDSSGRAVKSDYYPRFPDSFKFTVAAFYKAIKMPNDIDFNCPGWNDLIFGQDIRNRFTHPKSVESLGVTGNDLARMESGVQWYENVINHLLHKLEKESIYAHRFGNTPAAEITGN